MMKGHVDWRSIVTRASIRAVQVHVSSRLGRFGCRMSLELNNFPTGLKVAEVEASHPAHREAVHDQPVISAKTRYFGQFLAILHVLAISLAAVIIKWLPYHPFTCGIWRFQGIFLPYFLILIFQIAYEARSASKPELSEKATDEIHRPDSEESILSQLSSLTKNRKVVALLLIRGLCSTAAALLMYNAFTYISIADAIVLTSTEPIFVNLVAYFWLNEPCGVVPIICAFLSVVGIVIVARPPLITGEEEFNVHTTIGLSLAFGCLLCSTMIMTIVRYLRTFTRLHFAIIICVPGLCGTIVCVTMALALGHSIIPDSPHLALALFLGTLACLEQISITFALKFESAGPISIIKTAIVIFSFMWEFLFFGIAPDIYSIIGAGIVVVSVVGTVLHKWLNENNKGKYIQKSNS